jgi:hypothetical protein
MARKRWIRGHFIVPALLLADPAVPAEAENPPPRADEQLDEVVVGGIRLKPQRNAQKIIDWMARLVGSFTFEGHVDLRGRGNAADLLQVEGTGICTGFGPAPAVQCEIQVRWPEARGLNGEPIPGGVSHLDPAMILYGFEPNRLGIRYMLVGNRGVSNSDLAQLVGDALVSRKPCADFPGDCQRLMSVTAAPDLKQVEMRIELQVDGVKALEYAFVMRRVSGSAAVTHPGRSGK